jgi:hypothetical protein
MLILHGGQPYVSPASTLNKPFLETQTIKNGEPFQEPLPALGMLHMVTYRNSGSRSGSAVQRERAGSARSGLSRSAGHDDLSAEISGRPFIPHVEQGKFFDKDIVQGY